LRIPAEWSAARRKPRFERTEGSLSAMLADSQAALLRRDVFKPGPAFIDPSQEGRALPTLARRGPLVSFVWSGRLELYALSAAFAPPRSYVRFADGGFQGFPESGMLAELCANDTFGLNVVDCEWSFASK
jgi:hypothetical protein